MRELFPDSLRLNPYHQGLKALGRGLIPPHAGLRQHGGPGKRFLGKLPGLVGAVVLEGHPLYLGVQWRPGLSLAFSARPRLGRGSRELTLGGQVDAKGGRHVDSVELLRLAPSEEGKAC